MTKPNENRKSPLRLLDRLVMFFCSVRGHNWTCAAEEGISATKEQLEGGVEGFYDYATMYCKECGHVYEHSRNSSI